MRKELQTRQVVASYTTRHKRKLMNAQLGNNAGTVETGTADFWWIRLHGDDNQVVRARSSRDVVPNAGIDVVVELVQREGLPYYQILGRALGILYPTEPYANRVVGHHEQHEQGDAGAGGFDPVSVFPRMVAPLRAHEEAVPAMTVYVDAGDAALGSTHLRFLGGSSPAFSNPTTFNRFDLLYLGTDNALHVLAGTEASGWVTPTRPTMTAAGVPIAWVLLTASMTAIHEADIYDAGILRTGIELSSAVDLAATIHAATSKATPVDADEMPLADSAASFGLKKLTWANIKATLKTYLDTLYAVLAHTHTGTADSPNLADEVILHDKVGSPALFTLHDDWITRGSSGVIDGTQTYVTVGSTAVKISVIAGDGYVRLTNDQQGELVFCHWNASADIYTFSAPAAGQENVIFIGVEYSAGNVTAVTKTAFTDWNWFTNFPLARASYDGTTMRIVNLYAHAEDTANFARKVLRLTHPFEREEAPEGTGGLEISDVATRQIAMTAGRIWHGFNNLILNAIAAGTTFYTYYRRAGGGFNLGTATQWENTLYDDGSGTLQTMTANRYGTRWIYLDVSGNTVGSAYNGSLAMVYGSSNATSVANAQAETAPSIPAHLQYHGRLIGRIIFQKSAAAASLVESAWTNVFAASAVGNHALLSNLDYASAAHTGFTEVGHDHDGSPESKLIQANTHESPDTDVAPTSLHHTLGTGANQAAAGNDTRLTNERNPILKIFDWSVAAGGSGNDLDTSSAQWVRTTITGAGSPPQLTGMLAGADGDIKIVENLAANTISLNLMHDNAGSSANNRLNLAPFNGISTTWSIAPGYSWIFRYGANRWNFLALRQLVSETDLLLSDVTTNNATTSSHGLLQKLVAPSVGFSAIGIKAGDTGQSQNLVPPPQNALINGGFDFAQRQTATTLTTITDAKYSADRWKTFSENASFQYRRYKIGDASIDRTGLTAACYGQFKQITNAGKFAIAQIIEGVNTAPLIGRPVIFQVKLRSNANRTVKLALVEWQGTMDTLTADAISAWNADTTNPTFVTSYAIGTPVSCSVTTSFTNFSISATPSTSCTNLVCLIFTDSQVAANGYLEVSEAGLFDGAIVQPWLPRSTMHDFNLCLAYFFAKINNSGATQNVFVQPALPSTYAQVVWIAFGVVMRAAPTLTMVSPNYVNCTFSVAPASSEGFAIQVTVNAGAPAYIQMYVTNGNTLYTAEAEL